MTLKDIGNVPFKIGVLDSVFPDNSAIAAKAMRLEDSGKIVRLKRGMYVVAPSMSGVRLSEFLIANHLHGPSYVSMHTALRFYGLIPENVIETISVTLASARSYVNSVGTFRYVHASSEYYPIGIRSIAEGGIYYMMASPEKALCDLVIFTPNLNLRYRVEVKRYLEEYLRMDIEDLKDFDLEIMRMCAEKGRKKTMIRQIIKIIEYERNIRTDACAL